MAVDGDWRLTNGGDYLNGLVFARSIYVRYRDNWDHDHCELCFVKFMEGPTAPNEALSEGYCTKDGYRWVCETCFNDFKDHFGWEAAA